MQFGGALIWAVSQEGGAVCDSEYKALRPNNNLTLCIHVSSLSIMSCSVLHMLCAAEPAGLLRLPSDKQHRETLPHALHRAALPSHHGGA